MGRGLRGCHLSGGRFWGLGFGRLGGLFLGVGGLWWGLRGWRASFLLSSLSFGIGDWRLGMRMGFTGFDSGELKNVCFSGVYKS